MIPNQCTRSDLKKLRDCKQPMTSLKVRVKMYVDGKDGYEHFYTEFCAVNDEQDKFLNDAEWEVAVSEAYDPASVMFCFYCGPMRSVGCLCERSPSCMKMDSCVICLEKHFPDRRRDAREAVGEGG